MLYTTYFSKMKDIPEDAIKLIITRFPPKWIDVSSIPNVYIVKGLSPSQELLLNYKRDNDWNKYVISFNKEMDSKQDMKRMLSKLRTTLESGKDVYLICYEKDYMKCHRSLIGQYFGEEGIEWKELS